MKNLKNNNLFYTLAETQCFPFLKQGSVVADSKQAILLAQQAQALVAEHKFAEAVNIYTNAIATYEDQPFFYACRSMVHSALGDDESAFYDYQVAKRIDFNYHNFLEWWENRGTMEEAHELKEISNLIIKHPADPQQYINRALLQVQHFNYEEAVIDYSTAYELSGNLEILVSRAAVYLRMLRYDRALADLNEVLEKHGTYVSAYLLRAKLFTSVREYDLAKVDFEAAISLDPADETIFEQRAQFFEQLEDWESAIADYSIVIRQHTDDFFGYVMRADLYEKIGKFDLAIADYDKAIALNPYYSDLYQYRGDLKERTGDKLGAEADFQKFEELEKE